jgi:hypothetical protein
MKTGLRSGTELWNVGLEPTYQVIGNELRKAECVQRNSDINTEELEKELQIACVTAIAADNEP